MKEKERLPYYIPGWPAAPGCSPTDPMGSYTGIPEDPNEKPVQDADDL